MSNDGEPTAKWPAISRDLVANYLLNDSEIDELRTGQDSACEERSGKEARQSDRVPAHFSGFRLDQIESKKLSREPQSPSDVGLHLIRESISSFVEPENRSDYEARREQRRQALDSIRRALEELIADELTLDVLLAFASSQLRPSELARHLRKSPSTICRQRDRWHEFIRENWREGHWDCV